VIKISYQRKQTEPNCNTVGQKLGIKKHFCIVSTDRETERRSRNTQGRLRLMARGDLKWLQNI